MENRLEQNPNVNVKYTNHIICHLEGARKQGRCLLPLKRMEWVKKKVTRRHLSSWFILDTLFSLATGDTNLYRLT